jgi:hypothetical protein
MVRLKVCIVTTLPYENSATCENLIGYDHLTRQIPLSTTGYSLIHGASFASRITHIFAEMMLQEHLEASIFSCPSNSMP